MTRQKSKGRPVHDAVTAALQGTLNEGQQMAKQQLASPLEQAQMCIQTAQRDRSRLMAMLCILVQRNNNEIVLTMAELANLDANTELVQSNPTQIGFTLSTRIVPTN